jgi:ABC-type glycerol-3-phosphate transport system permease component
MFIKRKQIEEARRWIAVVIVAFIILFPVLWILSSSFTAADFLFTSPVRYFPKDPTLDNYRSLFGSMNINTMIFNTLIIAGTSIVLTILISFFAGYGFARVRFRGSALLFSMLTFSAMLPIIVSLVPLFRMMIVVKLNNTLIGLSLLYTSSFIPFTTLTFVNFIKDIPVSIEESAKVDGAGILRIMFRILFPLMRPVFATMAIIIFIWSLNEFMTPLIFGGENTNTLSVGLSMVPRANEYAVPWEKISALSTIIMVPIIFFVTVFQRHIMEGLLAGSVKQ